MTSFRKFATAPALAAAFSLTASPVLAADMPLSAAQVATDVELAWAPGDDTAHNHRYYRYRHRRVDAGDVLAGVLIIGGIAAIANAAKKSDRRYEPRDRRYPDPYRGDSRYDYDDARGIDRAVSMCVDAIERDQRVETVDAVNRNARGWEVTGSLFNGRGFTCSIGAKGRIEGIDYGTRGRDYQSGWEDRDDQGEDRDDDRYEARGEDRQYDDDYYASARARTQDAQPTYPGGPVEGDDEGAVDADIEFGTGYKGAGA